MPVRARGRSGNRDRCEMQLCRLILHAVRRNGLCLPARAVIAERGALFPSEEPREEIPRMGFCNVNADVILISYVMFARGEERETIFA